MPADLSSDEAAKHRKMLRSIFTNAGVLLSGKGFNALLSLGYLAFAARALGVESFGVLVLVHVFAQAVSDISKFQSWQVVLHHGHGPLERGEIEPLQRVLRFSFTLDLFSAVVGVLIAITGVLFFGDWLNWPQASRGAAIAYMTSIAFMVTSTPTGVLRLLDRFDLLALRSGGGGLTRFIGAGLGWWLHAGLNEFLLIWYLANLTGFVTLFGSALRQLWVRGLLTRFPLFGGPIAPPIPNIWRFVFSTNFNVTLGMAFSRLPTLAIGGLLGPAQAALFRVANQFAGAVNKPAKMVVPAMYPELVRMRASKDWRGLRAVSLKISLACGSVATLMVVIVAFAGGPVLELVMGPEFREASTVLTLIATSSAISIWGLPLEPLLISINKAGTVLILRSLVTMACLPLIYWFALMWGLVGVGCAAIVTSLAMLCIQLLPIYFWFRKRERKSRRPV